MAKTCAQIIDIFGGSLTKTAAFFGISVPSVHRWQRNSKIPDDQLISFAARLEIASGGAFSRRDQWPDTHLMYWPELAAASAPHAPPADAAVAQVAEAIGKLELMAEDQLAQVALDARVEIRKSANSSRAAIAEALHKDSLDGLNECQRANRIAAETVHQNSAVAATKTVAP